MGSRIGRRFSHTFAGPLPEVWHAMADTARYNAAAALPRQTITETLQPDGTIKLVARAKIGPFALQWEDLPCNWVRERWFEHRRRLENGPFATLDARFELTTAGDGCRGEYQIDVEPRGVLGRLLLGSGFLGRMERMFTHLATQADRFACGSQPLPFIAPATPLPAEARRRLDLVTRQLADSPYAHGLAQRLAAHVAEATEAEVERLRPLALARLWNVPERQAIEACLEATRLGMLELRWDLLCPRCRGAKASSGSLDRLPAGAHCGTCNIDYGRDFSRNVELTLRPAASIRPMETGEFCLLGPMSTPHIWAHVTLEPSEERVVEFTAPPGPYRLRTLEAGPETELEHDGERFPAVIIDTHTVSAGDLSRPGQVVLRNTTGQRRTGVIERRDWVRDALTADRVATLQAFRDLFADDVLRPGDEVAIRRVSLLFSDLKGSTALYDAIGDAAAYGLVREHFAYLAGIVREHDGAIVKTIGDAVMAAFHDPLQALRAAIAMQERVAAFNAASRAPVVLKLGLHDGPCIAVNLNDRLDYFGGTVNLAARLQGESRGSDVVISEPVAAAPGAAEIIATHQPRAETARLRGLATPVAFLRLNLVAPP